MMTLTRDEWQVNQLKTKRNEADGQINDLSNETGWHFGGTYSYKEEYKGQTTSSKCWIPPDVDRHLQEIAVLMKMKKHKIANAKFDVLAKKYGIEF